MSETRRALITGITGQDGSYLAELLLDKGYEVHGIIRRSSSFNTERIDHIYQDPHNPDPKLKLHYGDLCDANNLAKLMESVCPHEVYNLGAQSHVRVSFDMPIYTAETVAMGAYKLLEAIRDFQQRHGQQVRYYQASSSEMYGKVVETPQSEIPTSEEGGVLEGVVPTGTPAPTATPVCSRKLSMKLPNEQGSTKSRFWAFLLRLGST